MLRRTPVADRAAGAPTGEGKHLMLPHLCQHLHPPRGHRVRDIVRGYRPVCTSRAITLADGMAHLRPVKALRCAPTPRGGAHGLDRSSAEPKDGTYVMALWCAASMKHQGDHRLGFSTLGASRWQWRNVTFPTRQYTVNGDRRSVALLRPVADAAAQERVRDLVLQAYAECERTATEAAS